MSKRGVSLLDPVERLPLEERSSAALGESAFVCHDVSIGSSRNTELPLRNGTVRLRDDPPGGYTPGSKGFILCRRRTPTLK